MNARRFSLHHQSGVSLVEVMVAMIILLVGLLGLAGMMMQSQRAEMESYQRVQALTLVQGMAARMNANRMAAVCYAYTNGALGGPSLGPGGIAPTTCTTAQIINYYNKSLVAPYSPVSAPTVAEATAPAAQAAADLTQWDQELKGAAELDSSSNQVGAVINARGCITYTATGTQGELGEKSPATGLPTGKLLLGTGVYTISVAWQGMGDTAAPADTCGIGKYTNAQGVTDDAIRRVVSLNVRMAALTK